VFYAKNWESVLNSVTRQLANCDAFRVVCDQVRTNPYIDLEAVQDRLSDDVDLFAAHADQYGCEDLPKLISVTDPRVVCLAGYRFTTLLEFAHTLQVEQIPFVREYPISYPFRAILIDLWHSYCRIAGFENP